MTQKFDFLCPKDIIAKMAQSINHEVLTLEWRDGKD
jgi:hypothetical protein